jgi:hypothetical protein
MKILSIIFGTKLGQQAFSILVKVYYNYYVWLITSIYGTEWPKHKSISKFGTFQSLTKPFIGW